MAWRGGIRVGLVAAILASGAAAAVADLPADRQTAADPPAHEPAPALAQTPAPIPPPATEKPSFTDLLTAQKPTIELRGRLEIDAVFASQSQASQAQIGTIQDGFGFRRARLGAQGDIGSASRWVAEFEFSSGNVRFRDTYVGLTALPVADEVRVGYFREPFSLEGATSSRFITFMERSPNNQFDPTRDWGVAGYWRAESELATAALGAFRTGTATDGTSTGNADDWAVTGRVTGLPVYEDSELFRLVHLGAAISLRQPLDNVVTYKPGSQSSLLPIDDNDGTQLLPPITIPAKSQQIYNSQVATVYGPLSFQSEWFGTTIQQPGAGVVFLHGFYVYGSYFLTGEHRGYNRASGAFDHVSVLRPFLKTPTEGSTGLGAIELAARFSITNFASPNLPPQPPGTFGSTGGTILYEATWGVNWYLNDFTRIMANYTLSIPDCSGSPVLPVHTFGIRTAIYW